MDTRAQRDAAGDTTAPSGGLIEVHVGELRQLFNAMDAAPFRDRDLDPNAEQFIVEWGGEIRSDGPLTLVVHLSHETAKPDDAVVLRAAVREFFARRAVATRRKLRQLFRLGRTSLVIGLGFLATAIVFGDLITSMFGLYEIGRILRESFVIGGWVALSRPLEIFLYDWWPIRAEARLYDRLSAMSVRVIDAPAAGLHLGNR